MSNPFETLPFELAEQLEALSRLAFELRENAKQLLAQHGVDNPQSLLEALQSGQLDEHPGYEHYLSASILESARQVVRRKILAISTGCDDASHDDAPLLLVELQQAIGNAWAQHLSAPVELCQDALLVHLQQGIDVELRVLSPEAYSIAWQWGDAQQRIDTAPQPERPGPSHWHDVDGIVRPDPLTRPGSPPLDTVRAVMDALLRDPLLRASQNPA